jgi:hemin uptake protein HemP
VRAAVRPTAERMPPREPHERDRAPRRIHSPALFDGAREVVIVHQGQEYRLRITRADKLILTK